MAGRPRLPNEAAKVLGSALKNPKRFSDRPPSKAGTVGDPPAYLNDEAKKVWHVLSSEIPWLGHSDRSILEIASLIKAQINSGDLRTAMFTELRLCLGALGATPAARSKVSTGQDDSEKDAAAEFLN